MSSGQKVATKVVGVTLNKNGHKLITSGSLSKLENFRNGSHDSPINSAKVSPSFGLNSCQSSAENQKKKKSGDTSLYK